MPYVGTTSNVSGGNEYLCRNEKKIACKSVVDNFKKQNKVSKRKDFQTSKFSIPEVVFADDGRRFYPCIFCCRAFAYKDHQAAHLKLCQFKPNSHLSSNSTDVKKPSRNLSNIEETCEINISTPVRNVEKPSKILSQTGKKGIPSVQLANSKQQIKQNFQKTSPSNLTTSKYISSYNQSPTFNVKSDCNTVTKALEYQVQENVGSSSARLEGKKITEAIEKLPQISLQILPKKSNDFRNPKFCNTTDANSVNRKSSKKSVKQSEVLIIDDETPVRENYQRPVLSQNYGNLEVLGVNNKLETYQFEVQETFSNYRWNQQRILLPPDELAKCLDLFKASDRRVCTVCEKVLSGNWRRHFVSHSMLKTYACGICNKRFARQDHRKDHERRHKLTSTT